MPRGGLRPVAQIRHQEAGNPYEAVIVRGWVTDMTHDGDEHIDWLAKKSLDEETHPHRQPARSGSRSTSRPRW
jgi:hypothetical protein